MPRFSLFAVSLVAVAASALTALGGGYLPKAEDPTTFIAVLNAGQASILSESKSIGVAFGTFDEATKEFCFSISYDEPITRETGAHIHGPASPGSNASIVFDFSDPPGSPKTTCFGPVKPKQRRDLRAGLWYFNIHSDEYFQGEIRGQIVPVAAP